MAAAGLPSTRSSWACNSRSAASAGECRSWARRSAFSQRGRTTSSGCPQLASSSAARQEQLGIVGEELFKEGSAGQSLAQRFQNPRQPGGSQLERAPPVLTGSLRLAVQVFLQSKQVVEGRVIGDQQPGPVEISGSRLGPEKGGLVGSDHDLRLGQQRTGIAGQDELLQGRQQVVAPRRGHGLGEERLLACLAHQPEPEGQLQVGHARLGTGRERTDNQLRHGGKGPAVVQGQQAHLISVQVSLCQVVANPDVVGRQPDGPLQVVDARLGGLHVSDLAESSGHGTVSRSPVSPPALDGDHQPQGQQNDGPQVGSHPPKGVGCRLAGRPGVLSFPGRGRGGQAERDDLGGKDRRQKRNRRKVDAEVAHAVDNQSGETEQSPQSQPCRGMPGVVPHRPHPQGPDQSQQQEGQAQPDDPAFDQGLQELIVGMLIDDLVGVRRARQRLDVLKGPGAAPPDRKIREQSQAVPPHRQSVRRQGLPTGHGRQPLLDLIHAQPAEQGKGQGAQHRRRQDPVQL